LHDDVSAVAMTQISISSTYSVLDLKEDLKTMYHKAGAKDEGIMFLLTDSQITNERFLVHINDLLASGIIPDLFSVEEKDSIVGVVIGKVKAAGLPMDRVTCWNFFLSQVQQQQRQQRMRATVCRAAVVMIDAGTLCCARRLPGPQEPARVPVLLARERRVPHSSAAVPCHRVLHRHRLVPPLARCGGCVL
jgi:hypothetical protein